MRNDLKAAFRFLRSSASFSVAALVVLTLGIGASTAIFSVVDAVVLRALPFDEHDRLVAVGERYPARRMFGDTREPDALSSAAPQNYRDWLAEQQVFESMAAIASGWLTLREPGAEPQSLVPERVTASFFDVLRVRPAIGRPFTAENEVAGRDRVVVLSDGLWRRSFGGDPEVVGRTILLDDVEGGEGTYQVLGVMPPEFVYPVGALHGTDIWVPYVVPPNQHVRDPSSRSNYLQVIARLKPGVSIRRAQAQMDQVASAIEKANPDWNKDNHIGVRPLVDHMVGSRTRTWMLMLLGAVGIVLLIACANVANLLLARATAREREVGIRAALGASRWRLVRQLMLESLMLSIAGTVCAVVVASWGVHLLKDSLPDNLPRVSLIAVNLRVLTAAAAAAIVTGLLFGIVPALQLSRPDLSTALKDGARGTAGSGRRRLRSALVVVEVALAVVLLVGAALFIGSFVSVMKIDTGFDATNVLTAQVSPRIESRDAPRNRALELADLVDRIGHVPGVVHASMIVGGLPLAGGMSITTMSIPGRQIDLNADQGVSLRQVTADYHRAMRIPLKSGRLFERTDRDGAPGVVILNESAAKKYFPGENPIGRTVTLRGDRTIVGVVGDVHETSLELEPRAEAYVPLEQGPAYGGNLVIRTAGKPYQVLSGVKTAALAVFPDVPLRNVSTMEEVLSKRLAQRRLNMLLMGLFGLLGLVISAVGIYGVMACVVSQRTREIGVRMALGATPWNVVMMVLLNAGVLVSVGLVVGSAVAWYLSAAAKTLLFRLEPTDLRAYVATLIVLAVAALVATAIPARRAASVDPVEALRAE